MLLHCGMFSDIHVLCSFFFVCGFRLLLDCVKHSELKEKTHLDIPVAEFHMGARS